MLGQEYNREETLKIISNDEKVFYVNKEVACVSKTIQKMLNSEGQFRETLTKEVKFEEIRSEILEIVIQYFHYKFINENRSHYPKFSVEPNLALEVLRAALYLET